MRIDSKAGTDRRRFLKSVGVGAGAVMLAGCSGQSGTQETTASQSPTETTRESDGEAKSGGDLQVVNSSDPQNLDPHTTTTLAAQLILDNVGETLIDLDGNLNHVPLLAKDWTVSNGGKTYEFALKEGVQFQDPVGRELTAQDVKWTINRVLDPDTGSPRKSNLGPVDTIETPDDYTVRFVLKSPFAPFLNGLTEGNKIKILPADLDEELIKQQPVGTGPFSIKEWKSDEHVLLQKHSDYHGNKRPFLDSVSFNVVPEGASRLTQLQTDSAHVLFGVPYNKTKEVESGKGTSLEETSSRFSQSICFNTDVEPLTNPKVRRAIGLAISREQLLEATFFGHGKPMHSPVVPNTKWEQSMDLGTPPKQNIEKAKQLFDEAGVDPSSVELTLKTDNTQEGFSYVENATLIKDQLAQIGVTLNLKVMDVSTWIQEVWKNKNFDVTLVFFGTGYDPHAWYYRQFHSEGAFNRWNYANEELDALLEKGVKVTDHDKRAEVYTQVHNLLNEEAPTTYLYARNDLTGLTKQVGGYELNPVHQGYFGDTYLN